jgi:hypothetical protein
LSPVACASAPKSIVTLGIGPTTRIEVGQAVHLPLPSQEVRWTVEFDDTHLRAMSGAGEVSPAGGWTWVAIQPGPTSIVLNGRANCPQTCDTVPRIVIDVSIVKP